MRKYILIILSLFSSLALKSQDIKESNFHSHRGGRGAMPENSIPAFIQSIEENIFILEMDVVISADNEVVVSHDKYFSKLFCLEPNGNKIEKEKKYNLYKMDYREIARFDCGCQGHPKFPEQEKKSTRKPLLRDVITAVENHVENNHYDKKPIYSIEIKSRKIHYNKQQPQPEKFVNLVLNILSEYNLDDRVIIQSFDKNILREVKRQTREISTLFLIINLKRIERNIRQLGFVPTYYSPNYRLVKKRTIRKAKELKTKVIVWTVNDLEKMEKMVKLGVDGIMSDYLNLREKYIELVKKYEIKE